MKICLIAEGSYPYITGGVSSWIHNLVSRMPENEFIIYTIGANSKQAGKFKYKLPDNITEIKETFLDAYLSESGVWGRRFRLSEGDKQNLYALLANERNLNWAELFQFLRGKKLRNAADFLSSKDYFDVLEQICLTHYKLVPFTEMFWTVRSMILPLFLTIRNEIPKADIYHSISTGYAGVIGALAKQLYDKPLILTEHGIYSREREEEIIKAGWVKGYFKDLWINYFYSLSHCSYGSADKVVSLFTHNKAIQTEIGCDPDKIEVIPNGVNIENYTNLPSGPEDDMLRIGAVVRVVPIKDIKTMLQSFALIRRELPNVEFYVIGPYEEDEQYYEECLRLTQALELDCVFFTGTVRVSDYLGKMDILMLTSVSEGQPLAILEGMACAKPFVATNVGSCRELLEGLDDGIGPAGIIAPVMHYEQIAQAVIQLGKDEELRRQMGENARTRVEKLYKEDDVITNYRRLYNTVGGDSYGGNRI